MDLCACRGHLQIGRETMADNLLWLVPYEQTHRLAALKISKQAGILSPDGTEVRAVKSVMKLIANSPSATKVALMEVAWDGGPDKPALLNGQCM